MHKIKTMNIEGVDILSEQYSENNLFVKVDFSDNYCKNEFIRRSGPRRLCTATWNKKKY